MFSFYSERSNDRVEKNYELEPQYSRSASLSNNSHSNHFSSVTSSNEYEEGEIIGEIITLATEENLTALVSDDAYDTILFPIDDDDEENSIVEKKDRLDTTVEEKKDRLDTRLKAFSRRAFQRATVQPNTKRGRSNSENRREIKENSIFKSSSRKPFRRATLTSSLSLSEQQLTSTAAEASSTLNNISNNSAIAEVQDARLKSISNQLKVRKEEYSAVSNMPDSTFSNLISTLTLNEESVKGDDCLQEAERGVSSLLISGGDDDKNDVNMNNISKTKHQQNYDDNDIEKNNTLGDELSNSVGTNATFMSQQRQQQQKSKEKKENAEKCCRETKQLLKIKLMNTTNNNFSDWIQESPKWIKYMFAFFVLLFIISIILLSSGAFFKALM